MRNHAAAFPDNAFVDIALDTRGRDVIHGIAHSIQSLGPRRGKGLHAYDRLDVFRRCIDGVAARPAAIRTLARQAVPTGSVSGDVDDDDLNDHDD